MPRRSDTVVDFPQAISAERPEEVPVAIPLARIMPEVLAVTPAKVVARAIRQDQEEAEDLLQHTLLRMECLPEEVPESSVSVPMA